MSLSAASQYKIAPQDRRYHVGTTHITENLFRGNRELFSFNYSAQGQLNGLPSQTYDKDGNPHKINTIFWG